VLHLARAVMAATPEQARTGGRSEQDANTGERWRMMIEGSSSRPGLIGQPLIHNFAYGLAWSHWLMRGSLVVGLWVIGLAME
jgi:hypothetical protein